MLAAQALHQMGHDVLLVDADPAQPALAWSDEVEGFAFTIVGLAVKDTGRRLADYAGPDTIVVVDLPQAEDHDAIVRSVLRHVDKTPIPVAPSTIEIDRTGAIGDLLDEVAEVRTRPARTAEPLNRVITSARSGRDARAGLEMMGYEVPATQIPRCESYALAYGAPPILGLGDPITLLAEEYLRRAGVGFRSLHEALDTTTPGGRLVFHVFAALVEFLRELIVEGIREGLDAARAAGKRPGRPPCPDPRTTHPRPTRPARCHRRLHRPPAGREPRHAVQASARTLRPPCRESHLLGARLTGVVHVGSGIGW